MVHYPRFGYEDVRYADSEAVFRRALELCKKSKVTNVTDDMVGYGATVLGTEPYRVYIKDKSLDVGYCSCYLGQNDTYCKHMLALAIYVLHEHAVIDMEGRAAGDSRVTSDNARVYISKALRKIGAYSGPSSTWFSYQGKLDVAAGMIHDALPYIESSLVNAKYLWGLVLKISNKLATGGVDDSNGTIGGAVVAVVGRIVELSQHDPEIKKWVEKNCTDDTGFGFEEDVQTKIADM